MNGKATRHTVNFGVVPFLNMRPIVYPIEKRLVEHSMNIVYLEPSLLWQNLEVGNLDLAAVPSAEFLRNKGYYALPNISISSFGKVDSVILASKTGITSVKSVSVDSRSKSSTALLRIIFELFLGQKPQYIKRKPGKGFLDGVDAGMLIGNAGLRSLYQHNDCIAVRYDLGEIWTENTGLPFVYAVVAVKKSDKSFKENYKSLISAREKGVRLVSKIAKFESKKLGLSEKQCAVYMEKRIKYDFDEKKIEGLKRYRDLLFKLGEIKEINEIEFYEPQGQTNLGREKLKWKNG